MGTKARACPFCKEFFRPCGCATLDENLATSFLLLPKSFLNWSDDFQWRAISHSGDAFLCGRCEVQVAVR